ncbi:MAG: DUF58 domain-containing protein [Rickettsiales bacterium]|nr:DUF58 domain-containing protein [Rickettsiales bacterium]
MKVFLTNRFYTVLVGLIAAFLIGQYVSLIFLIAKVAAAATTVALLMDAYMLWMRGRIDVKRICSDRFSNGDENEVLIELDSHYDMAISVQVRDEAPVQFQLRAFQFDIQLAKEEAKLLNYQLRPTERGVYQFGFTNLLVSTSIGLLQRKIKGASPEEVKVYPSFIKMHQYELMAISQNLTMQGQKLIRRVGNSKEFDTIKDYVMGDDPRNINWAATARRGHLMSNHYIDERAQNIYCLIDKSRAMRMPFEGMTLLDYSINASLVISDIAMKKGDQAGLITFEHKIDTTIKANHRGAQIYHIMEALYHQQTSFNEVDIAAVYTHAVKNVNQRSLMLMFTNFESIHSLNRQLPYLKLINRKHLLIVIYFRNTEVDRLLEDKANSTREIYDQAIGRQMLEEKLLIRDELNKAGILSLYTTPQNLNVDVINKYIEVKAKRML